MSLKDLLNKELTDFRAWATDATFQAKLAKAEASSELRKVWMEAEQNLAKLEARVSDLGSDADEAVEMLRGKLKESWAKLKVDK